MNLRFEYLIALMLLGCGGFAGQRTDQPSEEIAINKERIATLELINKAGLPSAEVSYLSNLVRQAAGRLPQSTYGVITKDNIQVMLPEGKTLEDCTMECAVQTGREIGAHWVVTGEVVKFGGELRVSLSLHHSSSGELRGSDVVKGRDVKELEGPLQGTAVGLFAAIDPSLRRVAERLKRGFVFEKVTLSALPSLPTLEAEAQTAEPSLPSVAMPKAAQASAVKGVNFGSVDVEGLKLYDRTLYTDEQAEVSPEAKIRLWEQVGARVKGVKGLADQRIQAWRAFIAERERIDAERQRRAEEAARRAAELERRRQEALQELERVKARDAEQERERRARLERDWQKLSELLPLRVVSEEDKLSWVEAFLEAYGAVSGINPHVKDAKLKPYLSRLGARFDVFVEESEVELSRRSRRSEEIELKRCEVVLGIVGAQCLVVQRERERTLGIVWVKIPQGRFQMGSNDGSSDERPVHQVQVPGVLMSKTEVTVGQYRKCVEAGRCTKPNTNSSYCNWGKSDRDNHPINCVDWGQARTFAKWVGANVDLPTEAEWEYAARGGQNYKYAGSHDVDDVAWYTSNTHDTGTRAVGTKRANGYGLHDMSGNVWEWVLDEYSSSYEGAPKDGSKARGSVPSCGQMCDKGSARRVTRGGSWYYNAAYVRVAHRYYNSPDNRDNRLGFRLTKRQPFIKSF